MNRWQKIFYRYLPLGISLVVFAVAGYFFLDLSGDPNQTQAAWYSSSWTYRKPITIDHNKVASTSLDNFPMVFSVTDADLKYTGHGGKVGKTDGTDILFTSADGSTKLNHQIERYSSSTGETVIWVKIPSLSGSEDTQIYIYYGNSGSSDQQNATSTWDSNYKAVFHQNESTGSATYDSTVNGHVLSHINSPTQVTGKVDGSFNFNGSNEHFVASGAASVVNPNSTDITIEGWYNVGSFALNGIYNQRIINNTIDSATAYQLALGTDAGAVNTFAFLIRDSSLNYQNSITYTGWATNTWYHIVAVWNTTSNTSKMYVNGIEQNLTAQSSFGYGTADNFLYFGTRSDNNGHFNGTLDEIRLSNISRSPGWIQTSFNNQFSPFTFYAYGAQGLENRPSQTAAEKVRGGINIRGGVKFR